MLNGRLKSTKDIVLKVIRDNGYQVQDFNYSDLMEWLGECIDLIGCPYTLRKNIASIKIKDHRGLLPCDFHTPIQASAYDCKSGIQFPMRTATNSFHPLFLPNVNSVGVINTIKPIDYDDDGNPIFNFYNYEDNSINKNLVNNVLQDYRDITYELNDNYIFTSFKDSANVLFSYYAFPIDSEGFPMIPDNQKFREACAAFLRYKIDYKAWRRGKLDRAVFDHAEREKDWYIGAATTAGHTPSVDEMETWKNQLGRLIPKMNEHSTFFDTNGQQEALTLGNVFYRY
jgi:hypothetical protein